MLFYWIKFEDYQNLQTSTGQLRLTHLANFQEPMMVICTASTMNKLPYLPIRLGGEVVKKTITQPIPLDRPLFPWTCPPFPSPHPPEGLLHLGHCIHGRVHPSPLPTHLKDSSTLATVSMDVPTLPLSSPTWRTPPARPLYPWTCSPFPSPHIPEGLLQLSHCIHRHVHLSLLPTHLKDSSTLATISMDVSTLPLSPPTWRTPPAWPLYPWTCSPFPFPHIPEGLLQLSHCIHGRVHPSPLPTHLKDSFSSATVSMDVPTLPLSPPTWRTPPARPLYPWTCPPFPSLHPPEGLLQLGHCIHGRVQPSPLPTHLKDSSSSATVSMDVSTLPLSPPTWRTPPARPLYPWTCPPFPSPHPPEGLLQLGHCIHGRVHPSPLPTHLKDSSSSATVSMDVSTLPLSPPTWRTPPARPLYPWTCPPFPSPHPPEGLLQLGHCIHGRAHLSPLPTHLKDSSSSATVSMDVPTFPLSPPT